MLMSQHFETPRRCDAGETVAAFSRQPETRDVFQRPGGRTDEKWVNNSRPCIVAGIQKSSMFDGLYTLAR